jgi:histidinol-phosphate aminotransferase
VGNGSDEVLAHLWFAFLKGRRVQTLDTTYGFYPVWAGLYDAKLTEVPVLDDFSVDVDALKKDGAAIVLANPNAPTGQALTRDDIASLVDSNSDRLVVVDEAYFGFGAETAVPLIADYDNLIVTRSLSKSHALAGMRVGYAIAQPDLIEGLSRVKDSFNSYPLDVIAQAAATAAIEDRRWLEGASKTVREVRDVMSAGLQALGFEVLPSQANFIFTQHTALPGHFIFDALRARDILVRRWDKQRIKNWLRISVGTMAQAEQLLGVMREIVSPETG